MEVSCCILHRSYVDLFDVDCVVCKLTHLIFASYIYIGQWGLCVFTNETACEEWAFMRGECNTTNSNFEVYCADNGGEVTEENVVFNSEGNTPATYEMCTSNDEQCTDYDYYADNNCSFVPAAPDDTPPMIGMPNPASTGCAEKGGTDETLYDSTGGQYGVCVFNDGTACESWALESAECVEGTTPIFSTFCADSGGDISNAEVVFNSEGNAPATYEVCTVNGAQCAANIYYTTGCDLNGGEPIIGGADENGCFPGSSWCPETQECITTWMETCPIENGETFVGGTELVCVSGRCSSDEKCFWTDGSAQFGTYYFTDLSEVFEVPSGCTLNCTGCEPANVTNDTTPPMIGMPNPASTGCAEKGGTDETLYDSTGGQYGVCVFNDGTACESWALESAECVEGTTPIFSTFCADSGGDISNAEVVFNSEGNAPATYEVCTVNGAQCAANIYYTTGCDLNDGEPIIGGTDETTPPSATPPSSEPSGSDGLSHGVMVSLLVSIATMLLL